MRLLIAILVLFTTIAVITDTRATAGEWQEKPVMCGPEEEIFPLLRDKDERLVFAGKLFGKVRDPDEANGLSPIPATLPLKVYVNLETKTYTITETHPSYGQMCILSYGENFSSILLDVM